MAKNAKLDDLHVQVIAAKRYASSKTNLLLTLEHKEWLKPAQKQRGQGVEADVYHKTDF